MADAFEASRPIPRSNFDAKLTAYTGTAVTDQVLGNNPRRRWVAIHSLTTNASIAVIFLAHRTPGFGDPEFRISPGDTIVFSMTGDMPWQGGISMLAAAADSFAVNEITDYPYEGG